jgi:hypothetical protein
MRVIPSFSQRGKQPKGMLPLIPSFLKSIFQPSRGVIAIGGGLNGGGGSTMGWSPQERLIVSLRISTKPISAITTRLDALHASEDNKFRE